MPEGGAPPARTFLRQKGHLRVARGAPPPPASASAGGTGGTGSAPPTSTADDADGTDGTDGAVGINWPRAASRARGR